MQKGIFWWWQSGLPCLVALDRSGGVVVKVAQIGVQQQFVETVGLLSLGGVGSGGDCAVA